MEPTEKAGSKEKNKNAGIVTGLASNLWLICFTGRRENLYWWDKLGWSDPHFRHCFICQYQPDVEKWVMIDWKTGACDLVVFDHDEMNYILGLLERTEGCAVVLRSKKPVRDVQYRIPLLPVYCVLVVLQVLCWDTCWTITPKQLYKRIIKAGGYELVQYRRSCNGRKKWWKWRNSGTKSHQSDDPCQVAKGRESGSPG